MRWILRTASISMTLGSVLVGAGTATAQIATTAGANPQVIGNGASGHQHGYDVALPEPRTLGGEFTLRDQNGNVVSDQSLKGRWALIYFGYAGCAETCPMALQTIAASIDGLGPEGEKIQPVFVDFSVVYSRMHHKHSEHMGRIDPVKFASEVHPRLLLLSGPRKEMFGALRHYKVRQEHSPLAYAGKKAVMRIDHTTWIYLVDPAGKVSAYYYHNIASDALSADLAARLKS